MLTRSRINSGDIGFSSTGINGGFNSAWTIDGTLDMQHTNIIISYCLTSFNKLWVYAIS
jgi:hypothetical protein